MTSDTSLPTTPLTTPAVSEDTPATSTEAPTVPEATSPPTTPTDQTMDTVHAQAEEQMKAIEQFRTNWTAMAERRAGGPVFQQGGEPALKWIQPAAQGAVVVTLGEGAGSRTSSWCSNPSFRRQLDCGCTFPTRQPNS